MAGMSTAWIKVDDPTLEPGQLEVVLQVGEATVMSSADARQVAHGANARFTDYLWGSVPASVPDKCVVRGTKK
jgi:hypothetical protein